MKKTNGLMRQCLMTWTAALAALALVTPASAEAPPAGPDWTLQVDPLTTALGLVHVQVERTLGDQLSLYAGPSLKLFDGILAKEDEPSVKGFGLEAGLRWYFSPGAPEGGWALVRGVGMFLQTKGDSTPGGYISALVGYTLILDDWLVLAGGLGVQYIDLSVGGTGTKGVLPAAHTTVGVAF